MIRWILLVLSCMLAVAVAAVWQGRWGHVQSVMPDIEATLPAEISETSGVMRGHAVLDLIGPINGVALTWRAMAPELFAPRWLVALDFKTAGGLEAVLTLPMLQRQAHLNAPQGMINLGAIPDLPLPVSGQARIDRMQIALRLAQMPKAIARAEIEATVTDLVIQGADMGTARATLAMPDGLQSLAIDVIFLGGAVTGACTGNASTEEGPLNLSCTFEDTPGLPALWRNVLIKQSNGPAPMWQGSVTVALPFS